MIYFIVLKGSVLMGELRTYIFVTPLDNPPDINPAIEMKSLAPYDHCGTNIHR